MEALLSSTQADLAGQCDSQATLAKEVNYLEENLRQVSDFMHHSKDTHFLGVEFCKMNMCAVYATPQWLLTLCFIYCR